MTVVACGLIGFDAVAAKLIDEQSTHRESIVPNNLGGKTIAGLPGNQLVEWIALQQFRRSDRGLSVGTTGNQQANEFFYIPAPLVKMDRQLVKQCRVCRRLPLASKV